MHECACMSVHVCVYVCVWVVGGCVCQAHSQGGGLRGSIESPFVGERGGGNNNHISLHQYPCAHHQESISQSGSSCIQF